MKIAFALPLMLFIIIILILCRGLSLHPNQIPSPLINKPVPRFTLQTLNNTLFNSPTLFLRHITLLNVWATRCYACEDEHLFLLQLSNEKNIQLYGLAYKDNKNLASKWLKKYGNPYKEVLIDPLGTTAMDWGVYGTPETFVIDKKGIIRYKQIGPLTLKIWQEKIKPLISQMEGET